MPPERRTLAPTYEDSATVTVVGELRYYVVGGAARPTVQVLQNDGRSLTCSVSEPFRLLRQVDTNLTFEVRGFVLQIVEPAQYAGQVLTAHFDGLLASGDPFKAFALGRRYQMDVAHEFIGGTDFALCY